MFDFFRRHKLEIGIFLTVVAVRVLAFAFLSQIEHNLKFPFPLLEVDSREYHQIALNIKENGAFSLRAEAPFEPDSFRTPVYPYLAAAFLYLPGGVYSLVLFQSLLSGLIGVLAYRLGARFFSRTAGIFAAFVFALEPSAVLYANMAMTETLFLFFLMSAAWLFLKSEESPVNSLLSAALAGLAALTRPIGLLLPVLFAVLSLFSGLGLKKRVLTAVGIILISGAVVFPWALRNKTEFGSWSVSSVSSFNLYYYNAMRFYMSRTGASFEDAKAVFDSNIKNKYGEEAVKNDLRNASVFKKEALAVILSAPAKYAVFHLGTLVPFFLSDGIREAAQITKLVPRDFLGLRDFFLAGDIRGLLSALKNGGVLSAMFLAGFLFFFAVSLLALAGFGAAVLESGRRRAAIVLFSLIVLLALLSGVVTTARFRYAVSPLIFVLAGYGLEWLVLRLSAGRFIFPGR